MNRLNEAHMRAVQSHRKYSNTKAGLDELVRMRVAVARYDAKCRNRLKSLHIAIDDLMVPRVESVVLPKKEYSQKGSGDKKGVEPLPKKARNHSQNGGTIEEGKKGEVAHRQPSPIHSSKATPEAANPPGGGAAPVAPKKAARKQQLGGYVGLTPLEEMERREQLEAQKAALLAKGES